MNTICQFGYVSLEMLGCTPTDAGEYTCEVRNAAGHARATSRLTVNVRRDLEAERQARAQSLKHTEMKMTQVILHLILNSKALMTHHIAQPLNTSVIDSI